MTSAANSFPIIGIGASAGGIEALEGFFRGIPNDPGMAFVIVTHLSPNRESLLHEIVGRYTNLQVHVAADELPIELDNVYVLPADAILSIEKRRLRIQRPNSGRRERKPIDIFFSALAADQGELAVGVVLSGGDGDGTLGVKAIKERGGLTLAQVRDGYGPSHPDMPDSAIAAGFVDFAVPADEMGAKLVQFAHSLLLLDGIAENSRASDDGEALERTRQDICAVLRNQVGHDFGGYKTKTFMRRVQRRMQIRQVDAFEAYLELLREESQEVGALFRDLLINVTNFFRDADAFDNLAKIVVPKLFENRGAEDTIRIWVPGCATGEEVFSIGILMREHMEELSNMPRVQIFATDIDEHALGVARTGRYPATLLESLSPERRERFFVQDGGSCIIAKQVRDLCVFSPHSVIRDPPFSRIDLVSCRNLLIYFGTDVQGQVIPIFHYALRPEGYLFLGTSENISTFGDLFSPIEKKHRIFRRRSDSGAARLPLSLTSFRPGHLNEQQARKSPMGGVALRQSVEGQVLDQFAPPYVVVNQEGEVVFYSGRTGKYLEAAPGVPTRQILAIARKGLRLDLRTMLREAADAGRAVTRDRIAVESDDGRVQMIALTVAPVTNSGGHESLFLVLFADQGATLSREDAVARASAPHDTTSLQLETELRETRERLQSLIEEYETALEELKSSNEELVSVNEELQSTNEELEASKEELQSVNEELHTLNGDLNSKINSLDRANADLQNLFESTEIATVFLDRSLVIRSFTPAVTNVFNILPSDRGRPITDLSSHFSLPTLKEDIASVFAGHSAIERRLDQGEDQAHLLVRVGPYRNTEQKIEGVLVTFLDITSLTRAEARQRVLIAELQHRTRNLLAIVQSIATQTFPKNSVLASFSTRLAALGRVQSLISDAASSEIDLAELIRLELEAHGSEQGGKVTVNGPRVALNIDNVQIFALALHELTTNAVKYGALKSHEGRLDISWTLTTNARSPVLRLNWRESGVAMSSSDTSRRGYGRKLIEQALSYALQAKTDFLFGEDGVSCQVEMPLGAKAGDARV